MYFKQLYLSALLALWVAPAFALIDQDSAPRVIKIYEKISPKTLSRLQLALTRFNNLDPFPAGLIVLLDSPGGDGDMAMEIGRLLRQNNAHVFVTHRCDSACVFILMGGVVRAANQRSVGVHAARLTLMTHDGNVMKEIDASRDLNNTFQLTLYNTKVRKYLKEMGIHYGILDVILSYPPNRIYKLSAKDLNKFKINGVNQIYTYRRLKELSQMGYLSEATPEEFVRRSLSTPRQCGYLTANDKSFITCYRRVLQGHPI